MGQLAYPTAADLEAYLVSLGVYGAGAEELAALDLESKAAAAATEWEMRTGWKPFLAAGEETTRIYDPPWDRRYLGLGTGLLSVSSLMTDTGTNLLTEGTDFWLEPSHAADAGIPYEVVTFTGTPGSARRSISITGRWGYSLTVPDDAWQAILMRGALLAAPQLSMAAGGGGGVESVRVLSSEVRYTSAAQGGPLAAQQQGWHAMFDRAVQRYKRICVI